MAQDTIVRHKKEVTATREEFVKHKVDAEGRVKHMENVNRQKDDERREAEHVRISCCFLSCCFPLFGWSKHDFA